MAARADRKIGTVCGIAGIATTRPNRSLRGAAELMVSSMKHRGPDSHGIQEFASCLLANARLSIIDLNERGHMPMSTPDGRFWITYNGETYNAAELRAELEQQGHSFRTTSDTEIVIHLYQEFGEAFVTKLRGMFAFAIWDIREEKLVLGRDRLGIKPLYVHESGGQLIFASELKSLLASGLIPRSPNLAGVRAFLQLGHIPPPWSAIRGITPLPPGHLGIWKGGQWRTETYWRLSPNASTGASTRHLAGDLSQVLLDAMRSHLISDVPILLFLSGGADSACLGALARAAGASNLSAMTVGFGESEFDETSLTRRTAEALGIPLEVKTLDARSVESDLDRAIWALDEPSVDGLNSYWISKFGAEAGFKVALSGQGGDELFGGYESLAWFRRFDKMARWAKPLPRVPFRRLLDQSVFPFRWRKLSYLVGASDPFVAAQLAVKVLFLDRDVGQLISHSASPNGDYEEVRDHLTYWAKQVEKEDLGDRIAFMDIHTHLEPRLLRDLDAMSMAHSIEVRPVFLDHRVVEYLLPVPSSIRMQQKRLLLDAAKAFLPPALLADLESRKKRPFTFPFRRWLSHDLRQVFQEAFVSDRLRRTGILEPTAVGELWKRYERSEGAVGWSRIWDLFVLQRWCELMQVTL